MLIFADSLRQLSFGKLMEVYIDANREHGAELAPEESEARQIMLSEQAFYDYLHDDFFLHPGAFYAVWEEQGSYVSALRMEPHRDGLLLEALETKPEERRKGYAVKLVDAVLHSDRLDGAGKIYSHVSKTNEASLRTHYQCGFRVLWDYSAYIDGSVSHRAYTLIYER